MILRDELERQSANLHMQYGVVRFYLEEIVEDHVRFVFSELHDSSCEALVHEHALPPSHSYGFISKPSPNNRLNIRLVRMTGCTACSLLPWLSS